MGSDAVKHAQAEYDAAKAAWIAAQVRLGKAREALNAAKAQMPPEPRKPLAPMARLRGDAVNERNKMLISRHAMGATVTQLAAETGLSKGTVSSWIRYQKKRDADAAKQRRWREKYPVDPPFNAPDLDLTDAPFRYYFDWYQARYRVCPDLGTAEGLYALRNEYAPNKEPTTT